MSYRCISAIYAAESFTQVFSATLYGNKYTHDVTWHWMPATKKEPAAAISSYSHNFFEMSALVSRK